MLTRDALYIALIAATLILFFARPDHPLTGLALIAASVFTVLQLASRRRDGGGRFM